MTNTIPTRPLLTIDLTPKSMSGKSLSSMLTKAEWDTIRHAVYEEHNHECIYCGAHADRAFVQFSYQFASKTQKLEGITAVCPDCGLAKHFQAAMGNEYAAKIQAHVAKTNQWSDVMVEQHVQDAHALYEARSAQDWTLDASWLWKHYTVSDESKVRLLQGVTRAQQRTELQALKETMTYTPPASLEAQLATYFGDNTIPTEVLTEAVAKKSPKHARLIAMRHLIGQVSQKHLGSVPAFCKAVEDTGIRVVPSVASTGHVKGLGFYFEAEGSGVNERVSASLLDKMLAWPVLSKALGFNVKTDTRVLRQLQTDNTGVHVSLPL